MDQMNQIIEYKDIGKSYQGKWVVRHCNLTINEGDFLCIVGTSGSGKTTLLKWIDCARRRGHYYLWNSCH